MTTNQTPVQRCQYCGSDNLGLGWQHGEALVTYKKHGLLGSRLRYLICRRCGAVVYQWVAEPHNFPSIKTHTTGDMQRRAAEIVGGFLTDYLGEEMAPWQNAENTATAASV